MEFTSDVQPPRCIRPARRLEIHALLFPLEITLTRQRYYLSSMQADPRNDSLK